VQEVLPLQSEDVFEVTVCHDNSHNVVKENCCSMCMVTIPGAQIRWIYKDSIWSQVRNELCHQVVPWQ